MDVEYLPKTCTKFDHNCQSDSEVKQVDNNDDTSLYETRRINPFSAVETPACFAKYLWD
jgi:hypothetical protein